MFPSYKNHKLKQDFEVEMQTFPSDTNLMTKFPK